MRKIRKEPTSLYLERVHSRWEEMREMHTQGARVSAIAARFGISVARCYQILGKMGVTDVAHRTQNRRAELERILSYYYPGCSKRHLARLAGVKTNRLLYLLTLASSLGVALPWYNNDDDIDCD